MSYIDQPDTLATHGSAYVDRAIESRSTSTRHANRGECRPSRRLACRELVNATGSVTTPGITDDVVTVGLM